MMKTQSWFTAVSYLENLPLDALLNDPGKSYFSERKVVVCSFLPFVRGTA